MNKRKDTTKRASFREREKSLRASLAISRVFSTIMVILCCTLGIKYMDEHNESQLRITELEEQLTSITTDYEIMVEKYDSFNTTIAELTEISEELDEQNKALVKSNEEYYTELSELREREELYDKYEYALVNTSNKRTDITYDQLRTLEDLVAESDICDEDLILSWVMTESSGREKAKSATSTAKGYGQFLDGTSKFVYTKLMGNPISEWSPNIAYDGETSLEMMVAYIDYLYEKNDHDLYATIRSYRGKYDISGYVASIDSYLSNNNKSIQLIALNASTE